MNAAKIAITIDQKILNKLDILVNSRMFPNRSKAIQEAVYEKIERIEKSLLTQECKKLDPDFEQAMAEESFAVETDQWPEY